VGFEDGSSVIEINLETQTVRTRERKDQEEFVEGSKMRAILGSASLPEN